MRRQVGAVGGHTHLFIRLHQRRIDLCEGELLLDVGVGLPLHSKDKAASDDERH